MSPSSSSSSLPAGPRVRFAPSPTGYLHVGGARTALFNWLFARHHGGTLVLRIEDTDLERSTAEMVEGILQGMRWLGLDWDEGPYHQTQRMEMYRQSAAKLLGLRTCLLLLLHQGRTGAAPRGCDRRGPPASLRRHLPEDFSRGRRADAAPPAKPQPCVSPCPNPAARAFDDAVFGRVEFANTELEDFVLLRSDGGPTYHLSVVTDDVDMRITPHHPRRRSHFQHAQASSALPGAGRARCRCSRTCR